MYYSDQDFAEKVGDKPGNVRFFKKCLRDLGLIGSRQQLSDEYLEVFKAVSDYRDENRSTWEVAMESVLPRYVDQEDTKSDREILEEILAVLKRIEQKM